MNNIQIQELLKKTLNLKNVYITGDNNHMKIIAIGEIFKGMSSVNKQKIIYTPLLKMITEKHIHAISIESYTPEEWEKYNI